jgi:anaerobic ribonucleoside-triphosphate reductase activating protein
MNYSKINLCDIANGVGVRVSLWVSGCRNHCKGCFNPETWDFNHGQTFDGDTLKDIYYALDPYWISGLSILGGEPLEPENINDVTVTCETVRLAHPNKTIWLYTGYDWEAISNLPLIQYIDIVVDGKFIESLKDAKLHWRGSSNQRVIDVKNKRILL